MNYINFTEINSLSPSKFISKCIKKYYFLCERVLKNIGRANLYLIMYFRYSRSLLLKCIAKNRMNPKASPFVLSINYFFSASFFLEGSRRKNIIVVQKMGLWLFIKNNEYFLIFLVFCTLECPKLQAFLNYWKRYIVSYHAFCQNNRSCKKKSD